MKKHAFKRIMAMALIFVMCSFLMADNSLGIKAVTADDILVEESQVLSEIGAENLTSEVEVITSEEAEAEIDEEIISVDVADSDENEEEVISESEEFDLEMPDIQYADSCFYVTDSSGNIVYEGTSWDELLNKFKQYGNKTETYTIKVAGETTIGALPSNAAKIILVCEGDIAQWEWAPRIKCSSATLSVPVELEIQNATLAYGKYNDVVNVKLNGKTLTLNDAYGIGNVNGGNGNIIVKEGAEGKVNKVDKLNTVTIYEGGGFAVMDSITNVTTLRLNGILYSWGDITLNNILCDEVGEIHYDIEKKLTIKGTVTFDQGANAKNATIYLAPEIINGAVPERFEEGTVIVESGAKIKVSDFTLDNVPNYELDTEVENNVLYKEGNIIKIGIPAITVFDNHWASWEHAEAEDGIPFVTINDAIDYVNGRTSGYYFIRLEQDIPSAGTIKTLYTREGKLVIICAKDETPYTLSFSGTFTVDGCEVEIENVELRNSAKSYASVVLKNYAKLTLCDTEINALTAPAGTKVTIANDENETVDVTINGTAKCSGDFEVEDGAALWCKSALTAGNFTLDGETAELRILSGKAFTINGEVNIEDDAQLCINRVDKLGALTSIKAGTAMVTAENATADQFCTENIQAGSQDMSWLLTKSGKAIKTAYLVAYVYQPAEVTVNDKYYPFASFTEAKEFVASQDEYTPHYIELVRDSTGADLTDLPTNLVSIRIHESVAAEHVKLTANTDIVLSRELELENVNVVASGKTVYGNSYGLWMSNSNLTAGKAVEVSEIAIGNGTVTLTAKTGNTIDYVSVGEDATFKCPQFTGIEE